MKKIILSISAGLLLTGFTFAQDILPTDVPSVISNNFKKSYPKASSLDWEKEGELYKVDFEIGWFNDYTAWYSAAGERIKFLEEIAKKDLPAAVLSKINTDFKGYRVDDVKKITSGKVITYDVDLNNLKQDWDVVFDSNGKILSKKAD